MDYWVRTWTCAKRLGWRCEASWEGSYNTEAGYPIEPAGIPDPVYYAFGLMIEDGCHTGSAQTDEYSYHYIAHPMSQPAPAVILPLLDPRDTGT